MPSHINTMKTKLPGIMDLTDEEMVEELGRDAWCLGDRSTTRSERAIAMLHEGVRRILKNQIQQRTNKEMFNWRIADAELSKNQVVYKIVMNYDDIDTGYNPWI